MSAPGVAGAAPSAASGRRVNVGMVVGSAIVGGLVGYVSNVWIMAVRSDGYNVKSGSAAAAPGNYVQGSLFWVLAPMVVFAIGGYWRAVGTQRFFFEMRRLPGLLLTLGRAGGTTFQVQFLLGALVGVAASLLIGPSLGLIASLGFVAALPTAASSVLSSAGYKVTHFVASKLARSSPGAAPAPQGAGLMGSVVGMFGGAAALLVAFFVTSTTVKIVIAAVLVGLLVLRSWRMRSAPPAALLLLLLGLAAIAIVLMADPAAADDGGWVECSGESWWSCPGSDRVRELAAVPAVISAVSAATGAVFGPMIASLPGGSVFDDPEFLSPGDPGNGLDPGAADEWIRSTLEDSAYTEWTSAHSPSSPLSPEDFDDYMTWRHDQGLDDLPLPEPTVQPMDQPPPVAPEHPDIEWTSPNGVDQVLTWDPEHNGYVNILTGGLVDPADIEGWKRNIVDTVRATEEWRERNRALEAAGLDAQSQALAAIAAAKEAADARAAARTAEWKQWYRDRAERERDRAALDQEVRDEQWIWEGLKDTLEDLVVPAGRIGLAYGTYGVSEVLIQSYGATSEFMEAPDVGTGALNAARYLAENNLPVNSVGALASWAGGEEITWDQAAGAVGSDILATVGLTQRGTTSLPETIKSARDFQKGRFSAIEAREFQRAANKSGKVIQVRQQSPARVMDSPGKPTAIHEKTLKPWEEALYGKDTAGRVAARPPDPPPKGSSPEVVEAYNRRMERWDRYAKAEVDGLLAKDPSYGVNERGMLTKDGVEVSGDHDIQRISNRDGTTVADAEANSIAQGLQDTGRAGVMHGAEAQNPVKDAGHFERLDAPPGTVIRPRYIPGSGQFSDALQGEDR